jgi:nitrogen regulatory protein P-II 2
VKWIIAIIQPDRLDPVIESLSESGFDLVTVSDVIGRGRQKGVAQVYRSHVEPGNLLRKVKVEIGVADEAVQGAIAAVTRAARSGKIGDGKIFVLNIEQCVRIRTGETGEAAIS